MLLPDWMLREYPALSNVSTNQRQDAGLTTKTERHRPSGSGPDPDGRGSSQNNLHPSFSQSSATSSIGIWDNPATTATHYNGGATGAPPHQQPPHFQQQQHNGKSSTKNGLYADPLDTHPDGSPLTGTQQSGVYEEDDTTAMMSDMDGGDSPWEDLLLGDLGELMEEAVLPDRGQVDDLLQVVREQGDLLALPLREQGERWGEECCGGDSSDDEEVDVDELFGFADENNAASLKTIQDTLITSTVGGYFPKYGKHSLQRGRFSELATAAGGADFGAQKTAVRDIRQSMDTIPEIAFFRPTESPPYRRGTVNISKKNQESGFSGLLAKKKGRDVARGGCRWGVPTRR